jgi:hypothetical protein
MSDCECTEEYYCESCDEAGFCETEWMESRVPAIEADRERGEQ